jgi:GTP-binding protein EngB required for normal cell division
MICASKSDKLSKTAAQANCKMIADELDIEANIIPFSSQKGDGVELLLDIIKERCDVDYGQSKDQ